MYSEGGYNKVYHLQIQTLANTAAAGICRCRLRKHYDNTFDDNGKLIINNATNGGKSILANDATLDDPTADNLHCIL